MFALILLPSCAIALGQETFFDEQALPLMVFQPKFGYGLVFRRRFIRRSNRRQPLRPFPEYRNPPASERRLLVYAKRASSQSCRWRPTKLTAPFHRRMAAATHLLISDGNSWIVNTDGALDLGGINGLRLCPGGQSRRPIVLVRAPPNEDR